MRLLERDNNGELSLTKDLVNNLPAYAILSHTWGEDDQEVTFQDLTERSGKSKAGYQKIRFCGEQAAHDGFRYFWVDTCCIDKSKTPNSQRLLTLCTGGIEMRPNATSTSLMFPHEEIQMSRTLGPYGNQNSGTVDGLLGPGRFKSLLPHTQSNSSLGRTND